MALIIPRNRLAYPGGIPGVNPSHPAANNLRFSGFAGSGGGFINLLGRPSASTNVGSPATSINGYIGQSVTFSGAGDICGFSGQSMANDAQITLATIIYFNAPVANFQAFVGTSTNSGGYLLCTSWNGSNAQFGVYNFASGFINSGISLLANIPYFVAASLNAVGGMANFLVLNLATGAIISSSPSGSSSSSSPNGTYEVGNNNSQPANSAIATAMISATFLTLLQLLSWAADPWSFWYPQQVRSLLFSGLTYAPVGSSVQVHALKFRGDVGALMTH